MIASVSFHRFKALRATSLKLAPFNLIIGANGSGKTSLIQAVLRLRSLARLPLSTEGAKAPRKAGGPSIWFRFTAPHADLEARLECVSDVACDLLQVLPPGSSGWPQLQGEIGRIRSYLLDHYAMAGTAPTAPAGDTVLQGNGGNLGAALLSLSERHPADYAALAAETLRLMPEYTGIELGRAADGAVTLGLVLANNEGVVAADSLSQGSLYLLAILVLAFDPAPPTVLCIEEIDRGVHPRLLREIRDAFYRLSYPQSFGLKRAPVQVIATTHSPYLLDLFRDHPEEVVIAQKHGSASVFERLADRADLAELLKEGSLGDMWYSGILGGVPDEQ
ncbi:MAG: AAA family ATPase [Verrucomicrobia bacterium]|nr:AAA family ATPase [Verrucomicrobiota bacterium]